MSDNELSRDHIDGNRVDADVHAAAACRVLAHRAHVVFVPLGNGVEVVENVTHDSLQHEEKRLEVVFKLEIAPTKLLAHFRVVLVIEAEDQGWEDKLLAEETEAVHDDRVVLANGERNVPRAQVNRYIDMQGLPIEYELIDGETMHFPGVSEQPPPTPHFLFLMLQAVTFAGLCTTFAACYISLELYLWVWPRGAWPAKIRALLSMLALHFANVVSLIASAVLWHRLGMQDESIAVAVGSLVVQLVILEVTTRCIVVVTPPGDTNDTDKNTAA